MPRTQIRASQITDLDITDADIAAANKDGLANVPCLRTLGTGAQQAAAGNHTHSGLVTNGNLHDHEGGDGAPIPTGGIQDGAITAAKLAVVNAARVYNSTAIPIANSTATILPFNSERFDSNSLHDTDTNNSRLTAPISGLYLISLSIDWQANTSGRRTASIRLNGTTIIANGIQAPSTDGVCTQTVTTVYLLSAGDYVEARVFQTSGTTLNINVVSNYSPEFSMVYLGRIA